MEEIGIEYINAAKQELNADIVHLKYGNPYPIWHRKPIKAVFWLSDGYSIGVYNNGYFGMSGCMVKKDGHVYTAINHDNYFEITSNNKTMVMPGSCYNPDRLKDYIDKVVLK